MLPQYFSPCWWPTRNVRVGIVSEFSNYKVVNLPTCLIREDEVPFIQSWLHVFLSQYISSTLLLGFEETCGWVLGLTTFMSLHKRLLLLIANTWLRVDVWISLFLNLHALKLSVYQLVSGGWKVLYKNVLGLVTDSHTRPLSDRLYRLTLLRLILLGWFMVPCPSLLFLL